jgi:HIP---CoA ligase
LFAELFEEARTFGASLVASDIQPGDRVSIWAFSGVE